MEKSPQTQAFARQVAQAISTLRRQRGWSQEALAERLGINAKAIAKIESSDIDLRISTIWRLAVALDVSPGELLDTVPDGASGATIRHPGPLTGLAKTGWRRAKPHQESAVPVLDLRPRAGRGRPQLDPLAIAWALPPEGRHPREEGLFLAQIRGTSMQPQLRDGDWCLFSARFTDTDWLGKLALLRETDASGLTAWVVKRVTGIELGDGDQRRLLLASLNPDFPPRQVTLDGSGDVAVVALVRELLTPPAPSRRRS